VLVNYLVASCSRLLRMMRWLQDDSMPTVIRCQP